jgi:cellulose synthase/poly-beta-1,6-N-acetylglucosamine synthase-like glycosyltransferase
VTLFSFALALGALALLLVPIYYTLVAALVGALLPARPPPAGDLHEGVTAIICFVDEGNRLQETVHAFLGATGSFPREVLLSGDSPDSKTLELAKSLAYQDSRVRVLSSLRPRGKSSCQARALRQANFPFLLFLDARTRVSPEAPRQLALPLQDPGVAFTTGRLLYEGSQGPEESYWKLEHWIRRYQDHQGGPLGASGGLFACRRREFIACPPDAMLDLVLPCLLERTTGGRGRYVESALGLEPCRTDLAGWRRARIRIQARALGSSTMLRGWLAGCGWNQAGRFLAHKLLRWYATPSLLLLLLASSQGPSALALWSRGATLLLLPSLALATCLPDLKRLPALALPGYAIFVQAVGLGRALTGNIPRNWAP